MCLVTDFWNFIVYVFHLVLLERLNSILNCLALIHLFPSAILLTNQFVQIQMNSYSSVRNTVNIYKKYYKELNY